MTDTWTWLDADDRVFVEHLDSAAEALGNAADIVTCPECGQPAAVEWRTHLESTDGPIEHLKIRCLARGGRPGGHWFFLPADTLADGPDS